MLRFTPSVVGLVLVSAVLAPRAGAQEEPKAALMRTATELGSVRGALDRIARSALDALGVAEVTGTLALDLEQAQLALGCMSVNAECLGSVAEENGVQLLLAPRLDDTGDERVLTITLFDSRDGSIAQATRRVATAEGNDAILDSVPGLLRELFDLPPLEEEDPALSGGNGDNGTGGTGDGTGGSGTGDTGGGTIEPPPEDGIGAGGPILLGVGGAALIGGVVAAILFKGADDDWKTAAMTVSTPEQAMDAADLQSQAQSRGRAATALLIGGGVLAAGGLVWLLVDALGGDDSDSDGELTLTPHFGVGGGEIAAGLALEMDL